MKTPRPDKPCAASCSIGSSRKIDGDGLEAAGLTHKSWYDPCSVAKRPQKIEQRVPRSFSSSLIAVAESPWANDLVRSLSPAWTPAKEDERDRGTEFGGWGPTSGRGVDSRPARPTCRWERR